MEFTEKAKDRILSVLREAHEPLAVRIRVRTPSPLAPGYEMYLVGPEERTTEDIVRDYGGFEAFVDGASAPLLDGVRVDWVASPPEGGFNFERPLAHRAPTRTTIESLENRVERVINEKINPGIAAHGGRVELVGVRDNIVYLRMKGGCQGCGLASLTFTQGIERILRDAEPEIERVADVTDHAAGSAPYYLSDVESRVRPRQ